MVGTARLALMSLDRRHCRLPPSSFYTRVFGVNADIRKTCDELAEQGFIAVAPDLFWRQERALISALPPSQTGNTVFASTKPMTGTPAPWTLRTPPTSCPSCRTAVLSKTVNTSSLARIIGHSPVIQETEASYRVADPEAARRWYKQGVRVGREESIAKR
jgi:dienelactone hydrolase